MLVLEIDGGPLLDRTTLRGLLSPGMSEYGEEMFELEKRISQAGLDGDEEQRVYLAKALRDRGAVACTVCGTMINFHHFDGWIHQDPGMDHDARPDRAGFEWPAGLEMPGGRIGG